MCWLLDGYWSYNATEFLKRIFQKWLKEAVTFKRKVILIYNNSPARVTNATVEYLGKLKFQKERI